MNKTVIRTINIHGNHQCTINIPKHFAEKLELDRKINVIVELKSNYIKIRKLEMFH
ncbi:MAG: hypothetical protein IIA83_00395 [Thaumarchaeota archaeon]|nr:hypothetical protein [Nitrososphaerota archaeon]